MQPESSVAPLDARALRVELIGDEERCDTYSEQRFADHAAERWERERARRDRERAAQRASSSLGQRLDGALRSLNVASTVRASPVGRMASTTTDDGDPGPPRAEPPEVGANLAVIAYHVCEIEGLLDAERGLATRGLMTGDDKDRVIWEAFQGVRAEVVARDAPDLGGSASTIKRARKREADKRRVVASLATGEIKREMTKDEIAEMTGRV